MSCRFDRYGLTDPSMNRLDHRLVGVDPLSSGDIDTCQVGIEDV